jgi:hypothetical protein
LRLRHPRCARNSGRCRCQPQELPTFDLHLFPPHVFVSVAAGQPFGGALLT